MIHGYIRRRKDGNLQAVIKNGRQVLARRSTGYSRGQEEAAKAVLAEALAEIEAVRGPALAPGELTVREWGEKWIAGRSIKISSIEEAAILRNHVFPEVGHVGLAHLTKTMMLDWVKALPQRRSERTGEPLSPRTVHHIADVTRRCLGEAVDRELLARSPCVWRAKRDLPPKRDVNATAREDAALTVAETATLISSPSIPLARRVVYAGLLLAGPRPSELLARRVRDLDESWAPLPVLRAFTGWNTKARREGPTKTGAKKYLPVHPAWRALLREWLETGWAAAVGRPPLADDYLFPHDSAPLSGSNLNRWFKEDLERLHLPGGRSLYACRATFVSLAELGGATREQIRLITHPSPVQAFDFYTRIRTVWPARCRVVLAIKLPPIEEVTEVVTVAGTETKNPRNVDTLRGSQTVGAAGFEPATPAV